MGNIISSNATFSCLPTHRHENTLGKFSSSEEYIVKKLTKPKSNIIERVIPKPNIVRVDSHTSRDHHSCSKANLSTPFTGDSKTVVSPQQFTENKVDDELNYINDASGHCCRLSNGDQGVLDEYASCSTFQSDGTAAHEQIVNPNPMPPPEEIRSTSIENQTTGNQEIIV